MFCRNCGSQIDDRAVVCPHCGTQVSTSNTVPPPQYGAQQQQQQQPYAQQQQPYAQQQPYNPPKTDKSNPIAVVGFVLSFFVTIAGLICSIIGYNKAKNEGLDHKGLALAGIIISVIGMVFGVISFIFYLSVLGEIMDGAYNGYLALLSLL